MAQQEEAAAMAASSCFAPERSEGSAVVVVSAFAFALIFR
jgi:hypothetical protein